MQTVASTKSVKKAKPAKSAKPVKLEKAVEVAPAPVKVKGPSQPPRKPRLAKGIKVPREVKVLAALLHSTDRHAEKAMIRASAYEIHANELRAKTRGKDKKED